MKMRWTAARARVEALWAPAVLGHAGLHAARYRHAHDGEGRGWITWDGEQIATFETLPYLNRRQPLAQELHAVGTSVEDAWDLSEVITNRDGEFALWQFTDAVEAYPSLGVDEALASDDALIRALAMLDRRLGKRRLATLEIPAGEHEFIRRLHALRCEAEGLRRRAARPR